MVRTVLLPLFKWAVMNDLKHRMSLRPRGSSGTSLQVAAGSCSRCRGNVTGAAYSRRIARQLLQVRGARAARSAYPEDAIERMMREQVRLEPRRGPGAVEEDATGRGFAKAEHVAVCHEALHASRRKRHPAKVIRRRLKFLEYTLPPIRHFAPSNWPIDCLCPT